MTGWWHRGSATRVLLGDAAALVTLLAAVLVTACATAPIGPVPVDPRPVDTVPTAAVLDVAGPGAGLRVLQMNLCNSGIAGCYTGRSVDEAAAVIRREAPDVVTLNEICDDDVAVLERALAAAGPGPTTSAFRAAGDRRTGTAFRCRNGRAFGVGVVARTAPGAAYAADGGLYPVQDLRDPEERAWLCLHPTGRHPTAPAATPVAACTTHLIDSNPSVARAQCAYLLDTAVPAVRARSGAAPVVVGGDLNLRSGGSPDVRSCVPPGDRRADDGAVQHVVASPEFTVGSRRTIGLRATDHPGLLVTLTLPAAATR